MRDHLINIIFRKKNESSFSIEKVFDTILPEMRKKVKLNIHEARYRSGGLKSVLLNILYFRKIQGEIFHVTGDVHYAVFAFPPRKTILTIHDCVFLENAKGFKRFLMKKIWLQWPVSYAKTVTTISEKSKREIIANTNCSPEKVIVIPDPVSDTIAFAEKSFNYENPDILFIGTKPNKNLERVVLALKNIPCTLHIIGSLSPTQLSLLNENAINFKNYINLSNQEVADMYSITDMVLFPSLYEGFGLPVIEAQKAGRPVVTSDISPMNELAGNAACLVDPLNPDSIKQGITKVINDSGYRSQLISAGTVNANRFTPAMVSQLYLDLYKMILAK